MALPDPTSPAARVAYNIRLRQCATVDQWREIIQTTNPEAPGFVDIRDLRNSAFIAQLWGNTMRNRWHKALERMQILSLFTRTVQNKAYQIWVDHEYNAEEALATVIDHLKVLIEEKGLEHRETKQWQKIGDLLNRLDEYFDIHGIAG